MKNCAGFDIGGTSTRLRIFDDEGVSIFASRAPTREFREPQRLAARMAEMIGAALDAPGVDEIGCVGVGLAAQMSKDGEIVYNAPNLGWDHIRFADLLREALRRSATPATVQLVNDVNALAWAEATIGAGRSKRDILACYVGTGVGGALISNGQLLTGASGNAGEIGHIKVVPGGRTCGCGELGCLEAYAGGIHLERIVAPILSAAGHDRPHRDHAEGLLRDADRLSTDVEALDDVWQTATAHLGMTLANVCSLLNPEVLLLGGGVIENLPRFRALTLEKLDRWIPAVARQNLIISRPELGDEAGCVGAALYARSRLSVSGQSRA